MCLRDRHIEEYIAVGGYQAFAKVLFEQTPDDVIETILESNLRGRGGGGFQTGYKWKQVARQQEKTRYIVSVSYTHLDVYKRKIHTCNPAATPYCITEALIHAAKGEVDQALLFCGGRAYEAKTIETVKKVIDYFCKDCL